MKKTKKGNDYSPHHHNTKRELSLTCLDPILDPYAVPSLSEIPPNLANISLEGEVLAGNDSALRLPPSRAK